MTADEHRERHVKLHQALDELVADFIAQNRKRPSKTTVMELITWSHAQTLDPTTQESGFMPRSDVDALEADVKAGRASQACPPHMPVVVHRIGGKNAALSNHCGKCGAHLTRESVEQEWNATAPPAL